MRDTRLSTVLYSLLKVNDANANAVDGLFSRVRLVASVHFCRRRGVPNKRKRQTLFLSNRVATTRSTGRRLRPLRPPRGCVHASVARAEQPRG